jgi:signal transduction histidine kinase
MPGLLKFLSLSNWFIPQQKFKEATQKLYEKNVELLKQKIKDDIILDNITEGIVDCDENFYINLLNDSAKAILFGSKEVKDEVIARKNFFECAGFRTKLGSPLSKEFIIETKTFTGENYLVLESQGRQKSVYLYISEVNVTNQSKNYIISIRDVTADKELEKTKEDFISVTSHELRTPMTIIKSYLWMLGNEKKGTLNDKQREYLDKAIRGAERMLNLINDTLNISRIEQGRIEFKMEMSDLKETIEDITSEFKVKTDEKNIWLKTEYSPDISNFMVFADKTKLRETITNFLGNSIKFTKTGGIKIKVEQQPDGFLKTSIIDTGRGISLDDINKLFHKFGRLDNSYQTVAESGGTGLGLYIVKSLVEKMGGAVGVYSEGEGRGSTFWFTISQNPLNLDFK